MSSADDRYEQILTRTRALAMALPETYEEPAWIGVRWKIRRKTFAHMADIGLEPSPAFLRALGSRGPAVVLSFRSVSPELDVLVESGPPFYFGGWGRGQVLLAFDSATDWTEVAELIAESYRIMALKHLADLIDQPPSID